MGTKTCPKCRSVKPYSEFWKNKATRDGYQTWCKPCWYQNEVSILNGEKRPHKLRLRRNAHLLKKYGITADEFDKRLESQKGVCAICKKQNKSKIREMVVDHNHKTSELRGILCENCNRALGLFEDSIENLSAATEYLRKWY